MVYVSRNGTGTGEVVIDVLAADGLPIGMRQYLTTDTEHYLFLHLF